MANSIGCRLILAVLPVDFEKAGHLAHVAFKPLASGDAAAPPIGRPVSL
jgi:hypothetical protein